MTELHTESAPPPAAPSTGAASLELTILMPCLNEAETLEACVRMARAYLDIYADLVAADLDAEPAPVPTAAEAS